MESTTIPSTTKALKISIETKQLCFTVHVDPLCHQKLTQNIIILKTTEKHNIQPSILSIFPGAIFGGNCWMTNRSLGSWESLMWGF